MSSKTDKIMVFANATLGNRKQKLGFLTLLRHLYDRPFVTDAFVTDIFAALKVFLMVGSLYNTERFAAFDNSPPPSTSQASASTQGVGVGSRVG